MNSSGPQAAAESRVGLDLGRQRLDIARQRRNGPQPMADSVLSVGCRVLVAACERLGLDGDDLVRRAGLERRVIDDPDGRLYPAEVMALWQCAHERSGDEHLALHVAQAIPDGAYRVLEYLIASAPTVGEAFAKIGEYFAWIDTSAQLSTTPVGEYPALGVSAKGPPDAVPLAAIEYTFATCLLKVRTLTQQHVTPFRIDVARALTSGQAAVLEEFFGCPVNASAGRNCMLFERGAWELPSLRADPSLLSVLERHAQELVTAVAREPSLVAEVRRVLYGEGPTTSVAGVAKRLGMSARTLQRRLTETGHAFATIADAVRQDMARRLLREPSVAIAEAAFILNFADQSSFTRTFKRWTGLTPAAYRANESNERAGRG